MLSEELERLQALRDQGSITEEEFAAAKSKVLSQDQPAPPSPGPDDDNIFGMVPTTWFTLMHLSQLGGFVVPMAGFVAPIVMWVISKDENADADRHGRIILNWMASAFIYTIVCIALWIFIIGIPLFMALGVTSIVFAIMGAAKAGDGEFWDYPLSINFFKPAAGEHHNPASEIPKSGGGFHE
jgi:uncharacterized protein